MDSYAQNLAAYRTQKAFEIYMNRLELLGGSWLHVRRYKDGVRNPKTPDKSMTKTAKPMINAWAANSTPDVGIEHG